ncbi:MAG: RnfABCDGE type electron transport complex subunit B [Firmicutes bacterium]|nr:RnfABCDGE type electron transport complex subunit B [Bacillota bacterium]
MSMIGVSAAVLGGMGLAFGVVLGYAAKKFHVEQDPRLGAITEALPNANCGGCGYPGCSNFAQAILDGAAPPEGCPLGGMEVAAAIGTILGVEVKKTVRKVAFIRCAGGQSKSTFLYDYSGMNNCTAAMQLVAGGAKECAFGCLGGGSCFVACEFGAIIMEDGIAKVDNEKCVACGKCVSACPKNLIKMVPHDSNVRVACNSNDNGKTVRGCCKVGCIACRMCQKTCEFAAINVFDLLAEVDYEKCTDCGACVAKCPPKSIIRRNNEEETAEKPLETVAS